MCDKCANCNCGYVSNTTINSEQAGRDGLSSYDIAIRSGQFSGTESEFVEWTKGKQGSKGIDGIDGNSFIPVISNNIFNN